MNNAQRSLAFRDQLRADGGYRTAATRRAPCRFGSWGAGRAACFHARMLWLYVVARWLIVRRRFDLDAYAARSFKSVWITEDAGGRVEVDGLRHLAQASGPVVIVGNHMSSLETIMLPSLILPHKKVAFVVKQALVDHPIFGPIMRSVPMIPVGRKHAREDLKAVLEGGEALLRQGISVVIFPQATRSAVFDPEGFNTLGVKLAVRAGVPVIPLALKTDFMANGAWFKDVGPVDPAKTVHFAFGPGIPPADNGKRAHEQVVEFVRNHLLQWGGTVKGIGAT